MKKQQIILLSLALRSNDQQKKLKNNKKNIKNNEKIHKKKTKN